MNLNDLPTHAMVSKTGHRYTLPNRYRVSVNADGELTIRTPSGNEASVIEGEHGNAYRYNARHPVKIGTAGMAATDAFIKQHRDAIKAGEEIPGAVRKFTFFALF